MASAKYDHGNEVDERLMNQVVKYVNYDELGSLARDIRVQNYAYESVSAKKDRIFAVSSQNMSTRKARILHQRYGLTKRGYFGDKLWRSDLKSVKRHNMEIAQVCSNPSVIRTCKTYMSHFAYACKMGTRSTLCSKNSNISGSIKLFAL